MPPPIVPGHNANPEGAPFTVPGNRNDCRAYADSGVDRQVGNAMVIADGGYQGTGVVIPYRKPRDGSPPPAWQEDLNVVHRRARARVEHALAHLKAWNILRNCRRKGDGVYYATTGVALMPNLALTG